MCIVPISDCLSFVDDNALWCSFISQSVEGAGVHVGRKKGGGTATKVISSPLLFYFIIIFYCCLTSIRTGRKKDRGDCDQNDFFACSFFFSFFLMLFDIYCFDCCDLRIRSCSCMIKGLLHSIFVLFFLVVRRHSPLSAWSMYPFRGVEMFFFNKDHDSLREVNLRGGSCTSGEGRLVLFLRSFIFKCL